VAWRPVPPRRAGRCSNWAAQLSTFITTAPSSWPSAFACNLPCLALGRPGRHVRSQRQAQPCSDHAQTGKSRALPPGGNYGL